MERAHRHWLPSVGVIMIAATLGSASGCGEPAGASAASSAGVSSSSGSGSAARPNILFVIADDVGVDSTLAYADKDGDGKADDGRSYAPTPNLQKVCREGVLFRNAWSSPTCSPTRATMLTGRHGFRTGVGNVATPTSSIRIDEVTLPRMLDAASSGYRHALIGKWHLGTTAELGGSEAPNTMGWSHYAGSTGGEVKSFDAWTRTVDGVDADVTTYATTTNVDDAIAWIDSGDKSKPWVLSLAFNAPHIPLHVPPKGLHTYGDLSSSPMDIAKNPVPYYQAAFQALDTEFGRLRTWLEQNGQENTTIVFLGDNGTASSVVQAPYSGKRAKGTLYQDGINVPLCISGPGVEGGGREVTDLVHTVDLFATALDLAGVDRGATLPEGVPFDSVSLTPYLDKTATTALHPWVMSEIFGGMGMPGEVSGKAIRDARYKLIRFDAGGEELYDLTSDPLEATNLLSVGAPTGEAAAHQASLAASLTKVLASEPSGG